MTVLASLPMYDWPEIAGETDAFWAAIRDRLRAAGLEAPEALERGCPAVTQWSDPALLLSQTCGWPWATRYSDALHLVASPCYAVEGCDGPTYSSAIVVRAEARIAALDDLRGARVAFNGIDSQSGVQTLREAAAPLCRDGQPFFATGLATGAHRASIRAVAEGQADCAAIDAVSWALARAHEPAAQALRVIGWTRPAPSLPFVTASARVALVPQLRAAITDAVAAGGGAPLWLNGIAPANRARYLALPGRVAAAPPLAQEMPGS